MAVNLEQQLKGIKAKMLVVSEKYLRLRQAYDQLREENTGLRAQLSAQAVEIQRLSTQAEYMSIANTVKASRADLEATRAMVADLVREIDRCISDLTD